MKIKKLYKHDNKKQIWRILPTAENKVVLEERDPVSKEVFFCCFDIESGKKVFNQWQLDEKNWCGIESIYKDIIYFHLYGKPDMPDHKSIIAFDIKTQEILWSNDSLRFSSVYDDKVYCFKQGFESSIYYSLDYLSGDIIEDLGTDISTVKQIKEKSDEEFWKQNYLFPSYFKRTDDTIEDLSSYFGYLGGAKMIKKNEIDNWGYVRGMYHSGGFFRFNRDGFIYLIEGLTQQVILKPASNSMEIRNDTLFAGFRYPGIIKYLDESNVWRDYTDSIPTTRLDASSPYVEPTEISCFGDRMFVSTDIFGVLEWKKGTGWTDIAEGLRTYDWSDGKVFYPIVFLENIGNNLIAASGAPGYAAWGGYGVYRYNVK